ncbi:MAG: metal ABC transporter substrate-binding protein [Limisphaerales bacterium]
MSVPSQKPSPSPSPRTAPPTGRRRLRDTAASLRLPVSLSFFIGLALSSPLIPRDVAAAASSTPEPVVLTSFLPVHSLALDIAGSAGKVENWLPQGVDPHDFQFSPRDLRRLRSASLLVIGGLGLEGWSPSKLRDLAGNPSLRIVEATTGLPQAALIPDTNPHGHSHEGHDQEHDHDHVHDHDDDPAKADAPNPHFWLDPLLMAHAATNVATALQELNPSRREEYARNAAAAVESLHALHRDYTRALANATNAFITYHGAFPYLARRYNLRLVGVVESGPADQPSARRLSELGRVVRAENARVLFIDGEPTRLARRLAADLGLQIYALETLETGRLRPGAYEQGMRRNLEVLKKALSPSPSRPSP